MPVNSYHRTAVRVGEVPTPELFTPMFAASRVAGWCAHVDEQRAVGRLIRPASVYVGPSLFDLSATPDRVHHVSGISEGA